jgi:succinate dehydrogenase/fumarate reductase flavoprotein subunit
VRLSRPLWANRDMECDLLVIGGGAAGLSAAVTAAYHGLDVVVAEKAPVLGDATAWSGGWMWAPLNPLSQADGIVEDIAAPRTYLKHALGHEFDADRVEALLQNVRHMVAFFEKKTALQFVSGGLEATVVAFNEHARVGDDPEFGRGATAFNRASGDPVHQPNPSLAPLEKGPFYAIKVLPGSFGTFAGLKTDPQSRVLNQAGDPIPGLYCAGSDQANVMGGHYPSGGINIGPAMTFGYIAGRHVAGVPEGAGYENVVPDLNNDGV